MPVTIRRSTACHSTNSIAEDRRSSMLRRLCSDAEDLLLARSTPSGSKEQEDPLIPRHLLFHNAKYASPIISPDGKYLLYLAPNEQLVRNIYCIHVEDYLIAQSNATDDDWLLQGSSWLILRNDSLRGIDQIPFWASDSKTILYLEDDEGDENYHLWAANASQGNTKKARDLTPSFYSNTTTTPKVSQVFCSKHCPNKIFLGLNARDPHVFDMYECNLLTGELVLNTLNPGNVVGYKALEDGKSFQIRVAMVRNQEDSSTCIRVRDNNEDDTWRDLMTLPYGEDGNVLDIICDDSSNEQPKCCWVTSSVGRETTALLRVDWQTGEILETVFSVDKCNIGGVVLHPDTKQLRSVGYTFARLERHFFDEELQDDYQVLESLVSTGDDTDVVVCSKTQDEALWVVSCTRSDGPTEFVLYNQVNKTTTPLFVDRPELAHYKLAPMENVVITARDGTELVAYLTRASKSESTPLVLLVHGGPWDRDYWGFDARAQWFANRGYATLQVNYRGSSGYGKKFLHMGDGQWGVGDMQHDLTDAVKWAISQGIADETKICIYGGSYGGYACLAGLAFTPGLYCCGVDIVGPSNIQTLLKSIPPYWGPLRKAMTLKIGNVLEDDALNERISPLFHIDQMHAPLLIGHGANDPRVKQSEADQIAFSMQAKGIPVEYVLYPDEGHGFGRPANRIDFMGRVEMFLAKHLGGRTEPFERSPITTAMFPLKEYAAWKSGQKESL